MATDYEPIQRIILISAREPNPRRYTAMERIEKHFKVQPSVIDGINALGCRFEVERGRNNTSLFLANGTRLGTLPGCKSDQLNGGQYACAVAHYEAWQAILRRGWEDALILEDDAVFLKSARCFWHVRNTVKQHDERWQLIHLSGHQYPAIQGPIPWEGKTAWSARIPYAQAGVYRAKECGWSTVGYFISLEGARSLLDAVDQDGGPGATVIDAYTRYVPGDLLGGGYQVNQDFVQQDTTPSLIRRITQQDCPHKELSALDKATQTRNCLACGKQLFYGARNQGDKDFTLRGE